MAMTTPHTCHIPGNTAACVACGPARRWKVEVIADSTGKWVGNGLTFETREAAEDYGADLYRRWTAVREWRAVEVTS